MSTSAIVSVPSVGTGPILVTGTASGIGAAVAEQLRQSGHEVIGLDRAAAPGTIACDLGDPESIATVAAQLPAQLGGLANVAGVPGTSPAETVLRVNVLAPKLLAYAVLPRLAAGSGIVNVASVAATRNAASPEAVEELIAAETISDLTTWLQSYPTEGPAAYDTSKRVLVDWTPRLAAALLPHGVRALSVSPGPVTTPILADFAASMGQGSMERSVATVGRHGEPDEIAAVIAFALSAQARWLNGIDIPVEGGLWAARTASNYPALHVPADSPSSTDRENRS